MACRGIIHHQTSDSWSQLLESLSHTTRAQLTFFFFPWITRRSQVTCNKINESIIVTLRHPIITSKPSNFTGVCGGATKKNLNRLENTLCLSLCHCCWWWCFANDKDEKIRIIDTYSLNAHTWCQKTLIIMMRMIIPSRWSHDADESERTFTSRLQVAKMRNVTCTTSNIRICNIFLPCSSSFATHVWWSQISLCSNNNNVALCLCHGMPYHVCLARSLFVLFGSPLMHLWRVICNKFVRKAVRLVLVCALSTYFCTLWLTCLVQADRCNVKLCTLLNYLCK